VLDEEARYGLVLLIVFGRRCLMPNVALSRALRRVGYRSRSCRDADAELQTDAFLDCPHLLGGERAETVHEPYRRYGDYALGVECARPQELGRRGDFEARLAKSSRVRYQRDQRTV